MSFLSGDEQANTVWGRLILVACIGSYLIASIVHNTLLPIALALMLLLGAGVFYYIPLRLAYWLFTGDGEITNRFLLWLPIGLLTVVGILFMFTPMN
jgi:hypothetical protein